MNKDKFQIDSLKSQGAVSNGFYYPIDLDNFETGKPVEILTWTYFRYLTIDKNNNMYVLKDDELYNKFIKKDDWRRRQIDKIID